MIIMVVWLQTVAIVAMCVNDAHSVGVGSMPFISMKTNGVRLHWLHTDTIMMHKSVSGRVKYIKPFQIPNHPLTIRSPPDYTLEQKKGPT